MDYSFLRDKNFLFDLDKEHIKSNFVRLIILDLDENPIGKIEGRVTSGNITINGSSSMRRTASFSLEVEHYKNTLNEMLELLSIEKRIKIEKGVINTLTYNEKYKNYGEGENKILWFPQGIFLINQLSFTHGLNNITVNISCQDKMCLLNGTMGGSLPTSVTFGTYDQKIELYSTPFTSLSEIVNPSKFYIYAIKPEENADINYYQWDSGKFIYIGKNLKYDELNYTISVDQRIYDIIQTCVNNYGKIPLSKIIINDVPLQIKQIARYTGSETLWLQESNENRIFTYTLVAPENKDGWKKFEYNDEVGYVYTDFIYPSSKDFVTSIGDNVCTVLDKIIEILGNYEYFFDANGNFIFQEKRNYLNNSYNPVIENEKDNYYLNIRDYAHNFGGGADNKLPKYGLCVLDDYNYKLNLANTGKSVYNFNENNELIISYSNTPNYLNIKNDFHIWGKFDNAAVIHYHTVIKNKPNDFGMYKVKFHDDGSLELIDQIPGTDTSVIANGTLTLSNSFVEEQNLVSEGAHKVNNATLIIDDNSKYTENYIPNDWRAELYLRGLSKIKNQQRPDVYEQELLDLFDNVYNFKEKRFKEEGELKPNNLRYFLDFLEPNDTLHDFSVEQIGEKLHSYQEEKIVKIYNTDIPNCIMIDRDENKEIRDDIQARVAYEGEVLSNVDHQIMKDIVDTSAGYTAQEVMRTLLYQYTSYNEAISINTIPILYLEPNTRITISDSYSNISGDYIINSMTLPLDNGTMIINASRALERI